MMTFFCKTCCEEWAENYCDFCGSVLTDHTEVIDRTAGEPTEGNPAVQTGGNDTDD